jgi:hypothetical protein
MSSKQLRKLNISSGNEPVSKIKTIPEIVYHANLVNRNKDPYITGIGVENNQTVIFTVLLASVQIPYTIGEDNSVEFDKTAKA